MDLKEYMGAVCGLLSLNFSLNAQQQGLIQSILQLSDVRNIRRMLQEDNIRVFNVGTDSEDAWDGVELGSPVSRADSLRLRPLSTRHLQPDALVAFADPQAGGRLIYARIIESQSSIDNGEENWSMMCTIDCGKQRGRRVQTKAALLQAFASPQEAAIGFNDLFPHNVNWAETLEKQICEAARLLNEEEQMFMAQRILNACDSNRFADNDRCPNQEVLQRVRNAARQQLCRQVSDGDWQRMSYNAASSGRRYRSARADYRISGGFGGFGGGGFFGSRSGNFGAARTSGYSFGGSGNRCDTIAPAPGEAARYLRTAQGDAEAATATAVTAGADRACWVCYQSWQAAEKALKAVVLAEGRPANRSHSLVIQLNLIADDTLSDRLEPLVDDLCDVLTRDPRYPRGGVTPYDVFGTSQAVKASEAAASIVRLAEAAVLTADAKEIEICLCDSE